MRPTPHKTKKDQESVWDYPRPPRLEVVPKLIRVEFNSTYIAETRSAYRVLETSHPPVYYIPPHDIKMEFLKPVNEISWCEWKGEGHYYNVVVGNKRAARAAWYYPEPVNVFKDITNYIAFYARLMDACYIDEERVQPQPGEFYGGWITNDIVGPFKGEAGSWGW